MTEPVKPTGTPAAVPAPRTKDAARGQHQAEAARRRGHHIAAADLHGEVVLGIRVQQHHPQLSAVAGVDQTGRVNHGDAVPCRQARSRLDKPGVARRDGDREPRAHRPPLAGPQHDSLDAGKVEPRVIGVRRGGDARVGMQPLERDCDAHRPSERALASGMRSSRLKERRFCLSTHRAWRPSCPVAGATR